MFILRYDRMSFDKDLQIIQADVYMSIDGQAVVEEPLCIDVGLPALLAGCIRDVTPDRRAPAEQWERAPFFVCGCGDPECRAYCFVLKHLDSRQLQLIEIDQAADGSTRELDTYVVKLDEYRVQVVQIARKFLDFVSALDYRPYFADTVSVVHDLVDKIAAKTDRADS